MSAYNKIIEKLEGFYKKFYTNELIKGAILFSSLGLLYFLFTLTLEYFLWLSVLARTVLFWLFIMGELLLLLKLILFPIFQIFKLRKGISFLESSKIIGDFFPEVKDKLLNILQLKERANDSELVLASIEQKAKELQPVSFKRAINFRTNLKFLRYTTVPVLIWLLFFISGKNQQLQQSFTRVVNFETSYSPPAPFSFEILNTDLKAIQGKPLTIDVSTIGNTVPQEAKIKFLNQEYYLQKKNQQVFSYTFLSVNEPLEFYVEANGVQSQRYQIELIKTPTIQNIELKLEYPSYTRKKNETIQSRNQILVPEGTTITWSVTTNQTDSVAFIYNKQRRMFKEEQDNVFEYKKQLRKNIRYQISSSNKALKDYEKLPYVATVVKDEFPLIRVLSNTDSIQKRTINFIGQISDDYGLSKLELIYYKEDSPTEQKKHVLEINKEQIQSFFYDFPNGLSLDKGINYEFFFQVFDNDAINGKKKATSKKFHYRHKTQEEVDQEILENQRLTLNSLEKSIIQQKQQQKNIEKIQNEFQNKKEVLWNDKKKLNEFVKRQQQYNQMMQRQTEQLQQNFEDKKEQSASLEEQKTALKKRLDELKDLKRQQKLLDELKKLADKLNRDELIKKTKQLAEQNKQQERSLQHILELTKRFYVEQKMTQVSERLNSLSKEQDSVRIQSKPLQDQKKVEKKFQKISKELEELQKDNKKLKEPMGMPDVEDEKYDIEDAIEKAKQAIQENDKNKAKQQQKKASQKMKQMSQKMQQAMDAMQANMIDENIDDLKKILKNLLTFSFQQEELMERFDEINVTHPDFGKELKKQHQIKSYFEHIDDSLYVLSMRVPTISTKIQNDLSNAHYNLGQSLENFTENRFMSGVSNQQYVMTSANNLSHFLSNMLDNMQNNSRMSGKGKGNNQSFSLPTLIQRQKGLSEQMKKGMQKGKGKQEQQGKDGDKNNEDMNGELFKIFQQQSLLRQELEDAIKKQGKDAGTNAKRALKTMEQLENEILEKGFSPGTLQRMQQIEYQLLKLDKAAFEQGKDKKRKANTNYQQFNQRTIRQLQLQKRFYNQVEILNRQSLPLQEIFKKKIKEYFSNN